MRVLHRYLIIDFLVIFAMALMVISFVLFIGAIVKAIDLMAKGVAPHVLVQIFVHIIPFNLMFSIPMSVMVAALLLFGRLSMDGEITALRACGVSFRQIAAPVVLTSVVLSGICLFINYEISPNSHFIMRQARIESVGDIDPLTLLEEGEWNETFPGYSILIGSKSGSRVKGVEIIEEKGRGDASSRTIVAREGLIVANKERIELEITLSNVRVTERSSDDPIGRQIPMEEYTFTLSYKSILKAGDIHKRQKDMTFRELLSAMEKPALFFPKIPPDRLPAERTRAMVEANKRIAMGVACLSFTVLGIPLGIKSRRRESSAGILISLGLVFGFYFFILLAEAMVKHSSLRPDLIVWIPVIVSQVVGYRLMRRMN